MLVTKVWKMYGTCMQLGWNKYGICQIVFILQFNIYFIFYLYFGLPNGPWHPERALGHQGESWAPGPAPLRVPRTIWKPKVQTKHKISINKVWHKYDLAYSIFILYLLHIVCILCPYFGRIIALLYITRLRPCQIIVLFWYDALKINYVIIVLYFCIIVIVILT